MDVEDIQLERFYVGHAGHERGRQLEFVETIHVQRHRHDVKLRQRFEPDSDSLAIE